MMKMYFDIKSRQVLTATVVKYRGLPFDNAILANIGIYPLEFPYPEYDMDTEGMLPVGDPQPKPGDPTVYVQAFKVVPLPDEQLATKLAEVVEEKRRQALSSADESVAAYMSLFSDVERATWPTQQVEVNAYLADDKAPTPTLDGLAHARGIERSAMLEKAIAKVKAFEPLSVMIVGRQQGYEDAIAATASDTGRTLAKRIIALREMQFDYSDITVMVAGV